MRARGFHKQDSNPRYHAREVAVLRAQQSSSLASDLLHRLESRVVFMNYPPTPTANPAKPIPEVKVVDFRDYIIKMKLVTSPGSSGYC